MIDMKENSKEIIIKQSSDVGIDIFESVIDTFVTDNPLINFIPIAPIIKGTIAVYKSISTANQVKQIISFMNGVLSEQEEIKYVNKVTDLDELKKEIERTHLVLDRINDEKLSYILGNIFRAYVKREITVDQYNEINFIFSNLAYIDFEVLQQLINVRQNKAARDTNNSSRLRLLGLGLIYFDQSLIDKRNGITQGYHRLSDIAQYIIAYGNSNLYNKILLYIKNEIDAQTNKMIRLSSVKNYDDISLYFIRFLIEQFIANGQLEILEISEPINEKKEHIVKYLTIK